MNEARVRAVAVMNGWEGHFRQINKAGWHPVCENGVAILHETEEKALIAAYEAMNRHHFGAGILRDGDKASTARSKAEEQFGAVFQRGRKIEVERR